MEMNSQLHDPVKVTLFPTEQADNIDGLNVFEKRKISCPYQKTKP